MGGGKSFIVYYKIFICKAQFLGLSPHNYRLFRSVFPEVNKYVPLYFLKERTKLSFVMLLAVWHLGAVAEALFWIKRKLRAAFSRSKS